MCQSYSVAIAYRRRRPTVSFFVQIKQNSQTTTDKQIVMTTDERRPST